MLTRISKRFRVEEEGEVGEVRRRAVELAREIGFDETFMGKVALIATEMGTNLIRHSQAKGGELVVNLVKGSEGWGVEILSLDKGRGINDEVRCLTDGYSTGNSPGNGLGAIRRLATDFDLFSQPGLGTALLATLWPNASREAKEKLSTGGVCLALRGEICAGDAWAILHPSPHLFQMMVADGLGHGPHAAEAANEAVNIFENQDGVSPPQSLQAIHLALRKTRGAAVAVLGIDTQNHKLSFSGVGNISAAILQTEGHKGLLSSNGIVGHQMHRIVDLVVPWSPDSMLVVHSDGLQSRWSLDDEMIYPGLKRRHPTLIAGVLYRDFRRDNDDCTVAVVKHREAA